MGETRELRDGTGGSCMQSALQDAVASRMVADAAGDTTWSHLLVEAMAFVMTETDPGRLVARLKALDGVSADWQAALTPRLSDTIRNGERVT